MQKQEERTPMRTRRRRRSEGASGSSLPRSLLLLLFACIIYIISLLGLDFPTVTGTALAHKHRERAQAQAQSQSQGRGGALAHIDIEDRDNEEDGVYTHTRARSHSQSHSRRSRRDRSRVHERTMRQRENALDRERLHRALAREKEQEREKENGNADRYEREEAVELQDEVESKSAVNRRFAQMNSAQPWLHTHAHAHSHAHSHTHTHAQAQAQVRSHRTREEGSGSGFRFRSVAETAVPAAANANATAGNGTNNNNNNASKPESEIDMLAKIAKDMEATKNATKDMKSEVNLLQKEAAGGGAENATNDPNIDKGDFQWKPQTVKGIPPSPREGHSAVAVDSLMVVYGGCYLDKQCFSDVYVLQTDYLPDPSEAPQDDDDGASASASASMMRWLKPAVSGDVPPPREGHTATLVGAHMYIFGGSSTSGYLNDVAVLDVRPPPSAGMELAMAWGRPEVTGVAPAAREGHSGTYYEGRIYYIGGYTNAGFTNEVLVLDTVTEAWQRPSMAGKAPTAREGHTATLYKKRIYVFGGFTDGGCLNDVAILDLVTNTWESAAVGGKKPAFREDHMAIRDGARLLIVAGCNFGERKCYRDVHSLGFDDLSWNKAEVTGSQVDFASREDGTAAIVGGKIVLFGGCYLSSHCFKDTVILQPLGSDRNTLSCGADGECSGHGQCREYMNDTLACACAVGFRGYDCSTRYRCENDCSGHGTCTSSEECACEDGYGGPDCSDGVDLPMKVDAPMNSTNMTVPNATHSGANATNATSAKKNGTNATALPAPAPAPATAINTKPKAMAFSKIQSQTGLISKENEAGNSDPIAEHAKVHEEQKRQSKGKENVEETRGSVEDVPGGKCEDGCHENHGFCDRGRCYCRKGFMGKDCSMHEPVTAQRKLSKASASLGAVGLPVMRWVGGSFVVGLVAAYFTSHLSNVCRRSETKRQTLSSYNF